MKFCRCGCGQKAQDGKQLAESHPAQGCITCGRNGCPLALGHDRPAGWGRRGPKDGPEYSDFMGMPGVECIEGNEKDWRDGKGYLGIGNWKTYKLSYLGT